MPCRPYPLGGYADEPEDESFDAAGLLQSEGFRVKPVHEELVEVAYDCREQQEHRVLGHERLWQPGPSESVVHVVEDALLTTPEVVELKCGTSHHCSLQSSCVQQRGHRYPGHHLRPHDECHPPRLCLHSKKIA